MLLFMKINSRWKINDEREEPVYDRNVWWLDYLCVLLMHALQLYFDVKIQGVEKMHPQAIIKCSNNHPRISSMRAPLQSFAWAYLFPCLSAVFWPSGFRILTGPAFAGWLSPGPGHRIPPLLMMIKSVQSQATAGWATRGTSIRYLCCEPTAMHFCTTGSGCAILIYHSQSAVLAVSFRPSTWWAPLLWSTVTVQ